MTTIEATVPAAAAGPATPPRDGAARFVGDTNSFLGLLVRGAFLLLVTLGIYRFWFTTDIRRFLWSNTELAGETFEYTGTARELLLGFLFAIAVLVPLYVALFAVSLAPGLGVLSQLSSAIAFVLLMVLGQFAIYRARRYRLTRTIYRGVRFNQTGSAWRYALCAMFWSAMVVLTLGLAYPFMQSRLERFKMRHTFFGNLPGRFVGSGFGLLFRGVVMWLLVVGPLILALAIIATTIDWKAIATAAASAGEEGLESFVRQLENASPGLGGVVAGAVAALLWSLFMAFILYPVFQAMLLRWWASGLRFGEVALTSRLRTGSVFGAYARFLGLSMLWSTVVGIGSGMAAVAVNQGLKSWNADVGDIATVVVALAAYVVLMLGYSAIYQVTVKLALWRITVETLAVAGVAALERVAAQGQPSSAFGEGLADALNVGGL